MNFQEKIVVTAAQLRARAENLAQAAVEAAQTHAGTAAERVSGFKKSLAVLNDAGREFNQVARRHVGRFVKQNSPLVIAASKDVSQLARATFATLTQRSPAKKTRKSASTRTASASRKRARKAA
jgi:hypothetical protein